MSYEGPLKTRRIPSAVESHRTRERHLTPAQIALGQGPPRQRGPKPSWQAERDRLLRDSGFTDLEDSTGWMEPSIKLHGPIIGRDRSPAEIETLAEYYRQAGQLLHSHKFRTPVERRIWELHSDGASYTRVWHTVRREIQTGALPREKMYRRRVHATVTRLKGIMLGTTVVGKKRGRRVNPDSLRSEGLWLPGTLLSRSAAFALDHLRVLLKASKGEIVRRALEDFAKRNSSAT